MVDLRPGELREEAQDGELPDDPETEKRQYRPVDAGRQRPVLEDWPADDREIRATIPRTLRPDPDTEVYRAVEAAKGGTGHLHPLGRH